MFQYSAHLEVQGAEAEDPPVEEKHKDEEIDQSQPEPVAQGTANEKRRFGEWKRPGVQILCK